MYQHDRVDPHENLARTSSCRKCWTPPKASTTRPSTSWSPWSSCLLTSPRACTTTRSWKEFSPRHLFFLSYFLFYDLLFSILFPFPQFYFLSLFSFGFYFYFYSSFPSRFLFLSFSFPFLFSSILILFILFSQKRKKSTKNKTDVNQLRLHLQLTSDNNNNNKHQYQHHQHFLREEKNMPIYTSGSATCSSVYSTQFDKYAGSIIIFSEPECLSSL